MADVAVLFADQTLADGYSAPGVTFVGRAATRFGAPNGFTQWELSGAVESGSTLEWGEAPAHGDEGLYIDRGRIEIDGQTCESGGAVIVERGASARLTFLEDTQLVHFGQFGEAPSKRRDGSAPAIHVVAPSPREHADRNLTMFFFANGTCPGCDIVLFRIAGTAPHVEASHRHTADELIHVLSGALQVGRDRIETGMTIAVPANRLYGFRTQAAWDYVNYRPTTSDAYSGTGELYVYS